MSAADIAKALHLDLDEVLQALCDVNEYVASPRTKSLEPPTIRRVYAKLGRTYEEEPPPPVSGWENPKPPRSAQPTHDIPEVRGPFSTGSHDDSLGIDDPARDAKPGWAEQEWKLYGFTAVECDTWMAAGLRRGQAKVAQQLRTLGLRPSDLSIELNGWTVLQRIHHRIPLHDTLRRLEDYRRKNAG